MRAIGRACRGRRGIGSVVPPSLDVSLGGVSCGERIILHIWTGEFVHNVTLKRHEWPLWRSEGNAFPETYREGWRRLEARMSL
jgi:hypothetical protein